MQGFYLPSFCLPGSLNFIFRKCLRKSSTVECESEFSQYIFKNTFCCALICTVSIYLLLPHVLIFPYFLSYSLSGRHFIGPVSVPPSSQVRAGLLEKVPNQPSAKVKLHLLGANWRPWQLKLKTVTIPKWVARQKLSPNLARQCICGAELHETGGLSFCHFGGNLLNRRAETLSSNSALASTTLETSAKH